MVFSAKINVVLFLNIAFPLGHMQNVFRNSFQIQRLVERFRETRSIGEKRRYGRPSVLSNDSLEDIRARLLQSPRKSFKKLSQQTGMTYGSVQRAKKTSQTASIPSSFTPWVA
jgi:hypothetical protein